MIDDEIVKINAGKARSMDLITSALFELLATRPFADITVTDICERAGVARKTFYRNFDTKISVVERLVDQVFCEFMRKFDFTAHGSRKIYKYWFDYTLCAREFATVFFDAELYEFMVRKIREYVEIYVNGAHYGKASYDPLLAEYYMQFAASGVAAIMREWMKNDCKTSTETMAALTSRLLSGIL